MKGQEDAWWHRLKDRARTRLDRSKAEKIIERKRQLAAVAPVLRAMPWRRIEVGRSRLTDIDTFIEYYEMYASLLGEHVGALEYALDSGMYRFFDLYASAEIIMVTGFNGRGGSKKIVVMGKHYWEDTFTFRPHDYSPW